MLVVCIRQWQIGRKYACRMYTTMANRKKISLSYISAMRQHKLKLACRVYTTSANQVTIKNYPSANRLGYKNKVSARKGLIGTPLFAIVSILISLLPQSYLTNPFFTFITVFIKIVNITLNNIYF